MIDTGYMHIYKVHGRMGEPLSMTHTKEPITKKTAVMYHYGDGRKVAKKNLNKVVLPECDTVYMLTPDNELARNLFQAWLDGEIRDEESKIEFYKSVKEVVAAFKD